MLITEGVAGRVVGRDEGGIIAWPIADWPRLLPVGALTDHDVESGSQRRWGLGAPPADSRADPLLSTGFGSMRRTQPTRFQIP